MSRFPAVVKDMLQIEEAELNIVNGQPKLAAQMVERLSEPESPEGCSFLHKQGMAAGAENRVRAGLSRSATASLPTRVGGWLLEATVS